MKDKTYALKLAKQIFLICVGAFLSSIVLNGLYLPNHLLSGGIAGIAMLLNLTLGWGIGLVTFLINVPIFIAGYILMDKKYVLHSMIGMIALSGFLELTGGISVISRDTIVVIALGGVMYGFAIAIVALQHGSCGGNDIITRILHKYFTIPLGTSTLVINLSIFGASIYFFGFDITIMTLIANLVYSLSLNYFTETIFSTKMIMVHSEHTKEIKEQLGMDLFESVDFLNDDVLLLIMKKKQVQKVKRLILSVDPGALFTVSTIGIVKGSKMDTDYLNK